MIKKLKEKKQEAENGENILVMMIMVMTLTPIMTMLMITEKNSLQLLYSLFKVVPQINTLKRRSD